MSASERFARAVRAAEDGRWTSAHQHACAASRAGGELAALAAAIQAGWSVHVGAGAIVPAFLRASRIVRSSGSAMASAVLRTELLTTLLWRGRVDEAQRMVAHREEGTEEALPPLRRGRFHGYVAVAQLVEGDLERAEASARRARMLADRTGDPRWRGLSRCVIGFARAERGDASGAARDLETAREIALAAGDVLLASVIDLAAGELAFRRRAFDEAEALFARSVTVIERVGPLFGPLAWMSLCAALAERGDLDAAIAAERQARRAAMPRGPLRLALELRAFHLAIARGSSDRGRLEAALTAVRRARAHPALRSAAACLERSLAERAVLLRAPRDLAWIERAGGTRRSLVRSPGLRRLLELAITIGPERRLPAHAWIDALGWRVTTEREHVRAHARLHRAVHRLRRAIGPDVIVFAGSACGVGERGPHGPARLGGLSEHRADAPAGLGLGATVLFDWVDEGPLAGGASGSACAPLGLTR